METRRLRRDEEETGKGKERPEDDVLMMFLRRMILGRCLDRFEQNQVDDCFQSKNPSACPVSLFIYLFSCILLIKPLFSPKCLLGI